MHIGLIVSMKMGLGQFIYREISALEKQGATISLFPTKHRLDLYNPRPEWNVNYWSAWRVVLSQPLRFLSMPIRYLAVLWEAVRFGAVVDFMLAAYFAPRMKHVDVLYATFGDRKLFIGFFGKRLLGKPLAVELHADELYRNPNPKLFAVALAASDRIIAVTEYNRELLRDRFGIAPERVEVVRLFVDLQEFRPATEVRHFDRRLFCRTQGARDTLSGTQKAWLRRYGSVGGRRLRCGAGSSGRSQVGCRLRSRIASGFLREFARCRVAGRVSCLRRVLFAVPPRSPGLR